MGFIMVVLLTLSIVNVSMKDEIIHARVKKQIEKAENEKFESISQ
jgi:hypothetical protein